MKETSLASWQTFWTPILVLVVLFLAFYNLTLFFPPNWYDEGMHLTRDLDSDRCGMSTLGMYLLVLVFYRS